MSHEDPARRISFEMGSGYTTQTRSSNTPELRDIQPIATISNWNKNVLRERQICVCYYQVFYVPRIVCLGLLCYSLCT